MHETQSLPFPEENLETPEWGEENKALNVLERYLWKNPDSQEYKDFKKRIKEWASGDEIVYQIQKGYEASSHMLIKVLEESEVSPDNPEEVDSFNRIRDTILERFRNGESPHELIRELQAAKNKIEENAQERLEQADNINYIKGLIEVMYGSMFGSMGRFMWKTLGMNRYDEFMGRLDTWEDLESLLTDVEREAEGYIQSFQKQWDGEKKLLWNGNIRLEWSFLRNEIPSLPLGEDLLQKIDQNPKIRIRLYVRDIDHILSNGTIKEKMTFIWESRRHISRRIWEIKNHRATNDNK